MPIPTPQERPDLYDEGYDGRPEGSAKPGEQAYWDGLITPEMKQRIDSLRTGKTAEPSPEPAPEEKPA